jgi:Flp pilus assembly protein TadG
MIASCRRVRPSRAPSRGQALAEFALVAPLFFLLLFAIIDFGRYVYYVQVLNNAAREGTRYAIVHGERSLNPAGPAADDPDVTGVVRASAVGVIGDAATLVIHSSWEQSNPLDPPRNGRGDKVAVTVTYQFRSVIPVVPIPPIQVQGASTLVINN